MGDRPDPDDLLDRIDTLVSELHRLRNDVEELQKPVPDGGAAHPDHGSARERFDVGDRVSMVVEDDGSNTRHGDPVGRVDGVATFLKGDVDVDAGDQVDVRISTVEDRFMRGVLLGVDEP